MLTVIGRLQRPPPHETVIDAGIFARTNVPLVLIKSDARARLRPCLRCGYSLRNVPDARVCPECGLAVWLSLSGNDDLELSNPQWLRRVATAMLVLAAAHAILFAGVIAFHAWRMITADPWLGVYENWHVIGYVCAGYLGACGAGLMLLGGEEGRVPERARALRRAASAAGIVGLALAACVAAPVYAFHIPIFIGLLVAAFQAVFTWCYAQELARRIPSRRLEFFAKYLWIAVLVAFASVVFRGSIWTTWALYSPWSTRVIAWTLFLIAYPPLAIAMYVALARRYRSAAKAAMKNWDTPA